MKRFDWAGIFLPGVGVATLLLVWTFLSLKVATDLPHPLKTWEESKVYVLKPFFKDGELNQGMGRLAFYSLVRVAKGLTLALLVGTPLGFVLGMSRLFARAYDPIIQV